MTIAPAPAARSARTPWPGGRAGRLGALAVVRGPAVDVALAAVLLAVSGPGLFGRVGHEPAVPLALYPVAGVLVVAPLVVRRRWPVPVFAAVAALASVQWLLGIDVLVYDLAVLLALYTVAAHAGRRWSRPALGVSLLGGFMAWSRPPHALAGLVSVVVVVVAVWLLGDTLAARRAYLAEVEERAERLEREQRATARAAAAEERTRIAREMHDVVAHRISVMVAQADGAAYALDHDVEGVRRALDVTASSGRAALAELRRLLGVLRTADSGTLPQPGAADVDALVADMRAAGLPVRLVVRGTGEMDGALGLCVYRVVQESLTNVLKHAGAGTPVEVHLHADADAIEVAVTDRGRPAEASPPSIAATGGHGLPGMRERVAAFRGNFEAGPLAGGGWRVRAWLPR